MDLITAEIKALQTRCSRVDSDNATLRRCNAQRDTEIDLLNKYMVCANQLIARLAQLVNTYETSASHSPLNNGLNDGLVDTAKCMVKREQLALTVCSRQLSHWRKTHKKTAFDNPVNSDHTYATNNSINNNNNNKADNNSSSVGDHCSSPQFLVIPKTEPIDDFSDLDALCQLSPNPTSIATNQLNLRNKSANDFLLATEFFKSYIVNDKNTDGITVTVNRLPTDDDIHSALSPINVLSINLNEDSQNDKNDLESYNGLAVGDNSFDDCSDLKPIALPRVVTTNATTATTTTKKKRQNYFTKSTAKWEKRGELFRCLWKSCYYENRMKANLMKHHRRCHDQNDIHKCQHCSKRFSNIKVLRAHVQAIHRTTILSDGFVRRGSGNLRCPMPNCAHKYYIISHIWRHMRAVHGAKCCESVRRQYERERSSNSTISSEQVIDQIRIRRNGDYLAKRSGGGERTVTVAQNAWPCDYVNCQSSYNTKASLKRHQMSFHKRLSKKIFARYAGQPGYRFFIPRNTDSNTKPSEISKNTVNSIRKAVIKHSANNEITAATSDSANWFCDYHGCGRYYSSNSNLKKHQKQKHGKIKQNNKTNNSAETRKSDPVSHSSSQIKRANNDKRIFKCVMPKCGACFIYEKNLRSHQKNKHNIGGLDTNPKSKSSTTSSISCSSRSSSVAGDDSSSGESFECPYVGCEYVSRNKITFMRHYNAHFKSEDKPFKCVIVRCGYASNDLRGLRNHVLNKHSEQQFLRAMEQTGIQYPLW